MGKEYCVQEKMVYYVVELSEGGDSGIVCAEFDDEDEAIAYKEECEEEEATEEEE